MNTLFSSAPMRILFGLLLVVGLFALASITTLNFERAKFANTMPATISVTGEGEVTAVPDIGQFSFSVTAEADDAPTAQSDSAEAINEIISYLEAEGVAQVDIKTTSYNTYPRYRFEERICPAGSFCPPGEQILDGFEVSQTIAVKVRDTKRAGELISGVGERGATNISGLSFTTDDDSALSEQAREQAIADAKEKAQRLAAQLGVELTRLVNYYEETGPKYDYYAREEAQMQAMDDAGGSVPTIPMGENETSARVTLVYEVK